MYSGQDTLTGGFPHSDIRGSSIARISPQLIAACHVLLRLLAPRHPPNALIALNHHHHPHAGPKPAHTPREIYPGQLRMIVTAAAKNGSATLTHTLTNHSDSPVKQRTPSPHPITGHRGQRRIPSCSDPHPDLSPGRTHTLGRDTLHPRNNPGDGRDRTDDPLLAKQVLSH